MTTTRIRCCRECGEELDDAERDVMNLCDECWEDLTQEVYDGPWVEDGIMEYDPLGRRDDEMGM